MKNLRATYLSCYAPSLLNHIPSWKEWAAGNRTIPDEDESPKLEFTSPLFRRRLSQLTKMTVQTVHDTLEKAGRLQDTGDLKIFFAGNSGEISREFQINSQLIQDQEILPASFSLSVFNAAPAQATLALKMHGGYTAAYASKGNFSDSLMSAAAAVLCGDEKEILFVWSQEKIPQEYGSLKPEHSEPFSFAFILDAKDSGSNESCSTCFNIDSIRNLTAQDFLKTLLADL